MIAAIAQTIFAITLAVCSSNTPCSVQSPDDGLHVDCSSRQLTSLPVTWPDDVIWLDFSHNNLSELSELPHLTSLRHLDLSYNQLSGTLANNTFAMLGQLTWLSLHGNQLVGLTVGAMTGLVQLTFLDLSHNHILLDNDAYPPGVFAPLASLLKLQLVNNDYRLDGDFPNDVFTPLSKLQTLSIDTFSSSEFGSAFSGLTSLKTLDLGKDCRLKYFLNTTLAAFKNTSLEKFYLNAEHLTRLETCAFCHLPNLKVLSLTNAFIPLPEALEAMYGLQDQTLELLDLCGTQRTATAVTVDDHSARYIRNVCVVHMNVSNTYIQRVTSTSLYSPDSLLSKCIQEMAASKNRLIGDRPAFLKSFMLFKNLVRFDINTQYVYSVEKAGWGLSESRMQNFDEYLRKKNHTITFTCPQNLTFVNVSTALPRWGLQCVIFQAVNCGKLKTLDVSYSWMPHCMGTPIGITALETLDMSGNYCHIVSETIFDYLPTLLHLRLSSFHINHQFFRARAWRLFLKLPLLQTLDLSYNDLIDLDPHMLRAQRHLRELNLAGNRLQSLWLDMSVHSELRLLDLSKNMLPTLLPHERQALDALADTHGFTLRLRDNPLMCACSNLDMVRWLWTTSVRLDGDGSGANYMCVTETGEASDTASVMANYNVHWRRCVGQRALGAASAAFLLQLLALVLVYIVSRSWTHLAYAWKVMRRLRLPRRAHFRRDAYVGYADTDWELACVTLPDCLGERHGVRLLVRAFEELPGCVRAENIVQHIDDSWKVLLLVTPAFAADEWLCGFTVQQAQRSITDTMPDRVIVVLLDDPGRLPPMASLERLLRMVPETNVFHVHRDTTPADPVWEKLARTILGEEYRQ